MSLVAVLAVLPKRMVTKTKAAAVGLDSLQGRPPMAVMAVLGVAIRLVLAVLVE